MLELNQIHQGDCLEVMKALPDNSVDLVLTDPPYGIDINANSKAVGIRVDVSRKADGKIWDKGIPSKAIFDHIHRVSKNEIIFGANYFMEYLWSSPCYIVWDKRGNLPSVPFAPTEFAWTTFDRMSKKYTHINHGFIRDSKEIRYHPTQKPLKLIEEIIEDFSKPGDIILDPFLGSGTTAIACIRTGRNFIGIECEAEYVQIARDRIADELAQPTLPGIAPEKPKPEQMRLVNA